MTDLLKTLLDRDVDREIHGKHPLLKMRYDRNVREAYLYALCLAAIADDGKIGGREEWAIKRVGCALAMPQMDVSAVIKDVGRLGEDEQLQLLDEFSDTLAGKRECVSLLLIEFSKIWTCGNGRIEDIDGWRKLISDKCGCKYEGVKFKNGDDIIWSYVDILSKEAFGGCLRQYKNYFSLFDAHKMPCTIGHVVKRNKNFELVKGISPCDAEGQYRVLRRLSSRKWPDVDFLLPCDLEKMRKDILAEGIRNLEIDTLVDYLDNLRFLHSEVFGGRKFIFIRMMTFVCAYAGKIQNEDDLLLLNVLQYHTSPWSLNGYANFEVLCCIATGKLSKLEKDNAYRELRREARKKSTVRDMQSEKDKRMIGECR